MPKKVTLDPHHEKILHALDGHLDHVVFEQCAAELINQDGWSVVPVTGGQDDGFDGAVADGEGEPFSLIVTTGKDLYGNLIRNVERQRLKGWEGDRAIFATSREITPTIRGKLYETARELEVTLLQVYDRDKFAYLLYGSPSWCKRLLGLTGRPHALSVFPRTDRPRLGDHVYGRESEIRWLKSRQGDCLLVGGPGSGKTFLLQSLANEEQALFLVDEDREQLANDVRELQPSAVIIDDAHANPELIRSFDQLRKEIGAEHIRIIATCWISEVDQVRSELRLADKNVRYLNLIDADTMVEIIKSFGLEGPNQLIAIIREQAAGRPGLAATLVDLCMKDNVQRVVSGEAFVEQLSSQLTQTFDIDVKRLLAPFALGGDAGVRQSEVASFLGLPEFDISGKLARLATAGVIRERGNRALSVEPAPMRWILVRDIFFGGPGSLECAPLLDIVENPISATKTLIRAVARGAPFYDLLHLVERFNHLQLWAEYAKLGPTECEYVITQHPELIRIEDVAEAGLYYVPEIAIPQLLNHEGETMGLRQKDPLGYLRTWINDAYRDGKDGMSQRATLVRMANRWWKQTRNAKTAIRAMCIALKPSFRYLTPDPGTGRTIIGTQGTLQRPLLNEIMQFWTSVREIVDESGVFPFNEMHSMLINWLYLEGQKSGNSEENRVLRQNFVERMLSDLAGFTRGRPGLQNQLRRLFDTLGPNINVEIYLVLDPVFEAFFPGHILGAAEEEALIDSAARHLGVGERPSVEIAGTLAKIQEEALLADIEPHRSRVAERVCRKLADVAEYPVETAEACIHHRLPSVWLYPILFKAAIEGRKGWPSVMSRCLNDISYQEIGVSIILTISEPPPELLGASLALAENHLSFIHDLCSLGRVPGATLQALLCIDNPRVAVAAAIGHWLAEPEGKIESVDESLWRRAILRTLDDDANPIGFDSYEYELREILKSDSVLSEEWLQMGLDQGRGWFSLRGQEIAVKSVIPAMDIPQRSKVLRALPSEWNQTTHEIVGHLIDQDLDLYRELLDSNDLAHYHLSPLEGKPDSVWWKKAALALDAGCSVGRVVAASLKGDSEGWMGSESEMWVEWRTAFEALARIGEDDPRIQEVSIRGAEMIRAYEEPAVRRDRHRDVFGA